MIPAFIVGAFVVVLNGVYEVRFKKEGEKPEWRKAAWRTFHNAWPLCSFIFISNIV